MKNIFVLAFNTFQEARFNKVLHIAGGFAAILIVFSYFMGEVSLYQNVKVVKDVGMSIISLFGVFTAIFLGVTTLYKEIQLRTVYTIVSKPIRRWEVLLGKYIGMVFVLFSVVVLMSVFLYCITFTLEFRFDWSLLPAIFLIFIELCIVAALAVFFSSFSTPFLSGFFSFGLFLVGRVSYELGQFGERSKNEIFKSFATGVQKVFDLEGFNLRTEVVHGLPVYMHDVWYPVAYAFFLIGLSLFVSTLLFRKRDFK